MHIKILIIKKKDKQKNQYRYDRLELRKNMKIRKLIFLIIINSKSFNRNMNKNWATLGQKSLRIQTSIRRKQKKYKTTLNNRNVSRYSDFREDLHRRFQQFSKIQLFKNAKNKLLSILGRHNPVNYNRQYGFREQWEMFDRQNSENGYKTSKLYLFISLIRIFLLSSCIWSISMGVAFPIQNFWIKILLLIFCFTQTVKFSFIFSFLPFREKVCQFLQLVIMITYGVTVFILQQQEFRSLPSRIIGIIIIGQMYSKLSKIYGSIKNYHISSQYRDAVNLFDLFVLLIAITHIFGCFIYVTSEINPDKNWLTKIEINHRGWFDKYIYSLYFSSTTLLTVGYGDLSPTNVAEVLAVLLTQFIGIAIFAYTVNQIGVVLSSMHEKSQRIQKDLGSVENVGRVYRLEPNVLCKMRTQIINNKRLDDDLCIHQQSELIGKFSEDLRQKIKVESNMKAIKRSIFMMINWTGKFQNKVARKLIKQVYKAQQILPQNIGKQKLYILDKGKIDILNNSKLNYKACFQKILKSLCANKQQEVFLQNVYGYSTVISDRKINLNAIAKQTSICFTLTKSQFLELLAESQEDRQHFHEIKSKIELSRIPQQVQAPSITNIRQHYRPSTLYLIARKKYLDNDLNKRKQKRRRTVKTALTLTQNSYNSKERYQKYEKYQKFYQRMSQTDLKIQRVSSSIDLFESTSQQMNQFQILRSYQRYFRKSNIENIIQKLNSAKFPHIVNNMRSVFLRK